MTEPSHGEREAARERQSYVRHELRGPLAVMYPALSLLLEGGAGELTPKQREYLELVERNAERLERLLVAATDSGWLDCAGAATEPSAVQLGEVLDEILAVRRFGGEQGPPIQVEPSPGPPAIAWADRAQVRQIVTNLLRNAAQYDPAGRPIRVTLVASADSATVSIVVEDEGPGIPADELPHVFDFGVRGVAARDAAVPGLGIGLWTCRELAGRCVGSIAIRSDSGAGTTVTVTLPADAGRSAARRA